MDFGGISKDAVLRALLEGLESAGIGCSIAVAEGADLQRVYTNESYADMQGVSLDVARLRSPLETLSPDEAKRVHALYLAIQRGEMEQPKAVATRLLRSDGTELPIAISIGTFLIDTRRAIVGFVRDLSEPVAMQAKLKASEDRFRTIAEVCPDSIAIYAGGRCVYANPQALALYGTTAEDFSFDPWTHTPVEEREAMNAYVQRFLSGERVPPLTTRRTVASGETKLLESSLSATNIDGAMAILVFTRDITERERLQAEVLKQDRLASLGVLAAGVAHELNNPLTALRLIVGRVRGAASENVPGRELVADLDQVDDAVTRMSEIIGDLLFLARPGDHPAAHVDLAKVIESSVALLRAGIPECPEIRVDVGNLPPVNGVPSKLGQAVVNVVRNALQACVERGPSGKVSITAFATDGVATIVVEDNGAGIPEDVLPKLMTPFFTTKDGGTGLGLWITQGIMQAHGGRIEVASTLGAGTKVTLTLPA